MNHWFHLAIAILMPAASIVLFVVIYLNREKRITPAATESDEDLLAADTLGRIYPSLPGNVGKIPECAIHGAPFDVVRAFPPVPRKGNGAPLYLDALYEFMPHDMAVCVAPAERIARGPALRQRYARMIAALNRDPLEVSPQERQEIVAEYRQAFDKIKRAQQERFCIFDAALGTDAAILPQVEALRNAIKLLHWRADARIADGQLDLALDDVEMALTLGRDVRPRGVLLLQIMSAAIEGKVQESEVPQILLDHRLTEAQVERLAHIFARHVDEGADRLTESLRAEYPAQRDCLHRLELREDVGAVMGLPGMSYGTVVEKSLQNWGGVPQLGLAERIDATLKRMTSTDFAVEVDCLNNYFQAFLERAERGEREISLSELNTAFDRSKLNREGFLEYEIAIEWFRRATVRTNGTRCLVALRRWQMRNRKLLPPDLLTVCQSIGLNSVPIDDYSGQPLRWTIVDGEFVIYSVGPDRKDDEARIDLNADGKTGDIIFRLK